MINALPPKTETSRSSSNAYTDTNNIIIVSCGIVFIVLIVIVLKKQRKLREKESNKETVVEEQPQYVDNIYDQVSDDETPNQYDELNIGSNYDLAQEPRYVEPVLSNRQATYDIVEAEYEVANNDYSSEALYDNSSKAL